jgi:asparagine synthase (glutamine-hydrolysing)
MAGIAGIFAPHRRKELDLMLDRIAHRGGAGRAVSETDNRTWGIVATRAQAHATERIADEVQDYVDEGHFAAARTADGRPLLVRDPLGLAPLYYGHTDDGALCFASEAKGLLAVTGDVRILPPGHRYNGAELERYFLLERRPTVNDPAETIAAELHRRLAEAVEKCIHGRVAGSWLSGGLDSSAIAALARPHIDVLHTFAAGLPGAPDLAFAREVADFIDSEHHEVVVSFEDLLRVLPEVIFHLESFDALLVRSSLTNYLAAQAASQYVPAVFSGEGGDELFAGYDYLRSIDPTTLADELIDITCRLHNTALQRVDRCASAHGTVAHVCFLDPDVVDYALRIPVDLKLHDGVEKWILRLAMAGKLPERILNRRKAKFWEGAGVGDLLLRHAEERVSDDDFIRERRLPNGWTINTKEELLYYRVFRETFGAASDLSWMGRTKGAPRVANHREA